MRTELAFPLPAWLSFLNECEATLLPSLKDVALICSLKTSIIFVDAQWEGAELSKAAI